MITVSEIKKSLQEHGQFWISFTGDSITSCEWVHPNWREIIEYVLKEELTKTLGGDWKTSEWGIRTFNFAYDGSTTTDILEKINNILFVKPNLVIGLMGGNDPTFKISVDESIQNIATIAKKVINSGAKLVWSNSTPAGKGSKKNSEYAPYAKALMTSFNNNEDIQVVDMFTKYQQFSLKRIFTFISQEIPQEDIKNGDPDLSHPNQLGNAYIARVMLKEVFDIEFDPEKYIITTARGIKYPKY